MQKPEITLKDLVGLLPLTLGQAIKYLDHNNYKLRGCEAALLNNVDIASKDLNTVNTVTKVPLLYFGKLSNITNEGEITLLIQEKKEENLVPMELWEGILIVFKDGKPKYAIM
ncbi:MAG: hypothetical protein NT085_03450 [candidate division SR1 bacterium]|nr:hypothetical protein [candidate division SR1 bacterium]